jgi:hypothetical protein
MIRILRSLSCTQIGRNVTGWDPAAGGQGTVGCVQHPLAYIFAVENCYGGAMTKDQVKAILDRVLTWPEEEQERVARFAREVERRRGGDDISEDEWKIIEERAQRRDLASDEEVEALFGRYRSA